MRKQNDSFDGTEMTRDPAPIQKTIDTEIEKQASIISVEKDVELEEEEQEDLGEEPQIEEEDVDQIEEEEVEDPEEAINEEEVEEEAAEEEQQLPLGERPLTMADILAEKLRQKVVG